MLRRNFLIWEVPRNEEFVPLKNGLDAEKDNPKTCREAVMQQHAKWLREIGGKFLRNQTTASPDENRDYSNDPSIEVEISPLVSYHGEVRTRFLIDHFNQNFLNLNLTKRA